MRQALALAVPLAYAGRDAVSPMPAYNPVTDARLANAATDDGWLMYRHDYTSSGYSRARSGSTGDNVDRR